VDLKAEYSALSSTRSQKKKLKQTTPVFVRLYCIAVVCNCQFRTLNNNEENYWY